MQREPHLNNAALFARREAEVGMQLAPCTECGYPTSSGDRCGVCRIRSAVAGDS